MYITVKALSIGTDRSEQAVLPQIILLLMKQSDLVYTVCYSIPTFLDKPFWCKTIPLHFYNNNGYHDSVPVFRIFTVHVKLIAYMYYTR